MITADQVLAFGVAALILIAIPGPSVVFVIGRALSYGRPAALASVFGNGLGLLTVTALVAVGLGVIVQESVEVFMVLKLAGAAYLVWLGIEAFRHRYGYQMAGLVGEKDRMTVRRAMRQGYVVGVTNPKGFVILGAVLPQFVDRGAGHVQLQMLLLGLLAFTIGILSDSLWALLASQLRDWFARSPRRGAAIGATGGLSMIGLGVGLAVTGETH